MGQREITPFGRDHGPHCRLYAADLRNSVYRTFLVRDPIFDMRNLSYYENLPDVMTCDQLEDEFKQILSDASRPVASITSGILFELSDRQWHTYELASEQLRQEVSNLILEIWDDKDVDQANALLGVIGHLGLGTALQSLIEKDSSSFSTAVRIAIDEAIRELGETVE